MYKKIKYINREYVDKIDQMYDSGIEIPRRQSIYYSSMKGTLNKDVYYVMDYDEKVEYAKSYNDPIYFIEKYLKIKLRPYQKEWCKLYNENRFIIYNTSRQTGINTILSALELHSMIFHSKTTCMLSNKLCNAREYLDLVKEYYLMIPYFLKSSVLMWNGDMIRLSNYSCLKVSSSSSIFIGQNYDNYIILDFAFHKNMNHIYHLLFPLVNALRNSKLIIASTPNGNNLYYDLYRCSILPDGHPDKNVFKSIQTFWYEIPSRDNKWREEMIYMLGSKEAFEREYELRFF